jgi:hypothetical protein
MFRAILQCPIFLLLHTFAAKPHVPPHLLNRYTAVRRKSYGKLCRRRKAAEHDSEEAWDRSFRGTRNREPIQKHQYMPQNCLQFVNGVTHLDRLGVKTQPILLVGQEVLDILALTMVPLQANFFLITLRIFFWSNFLGRPWTVVKVLRPLRSAGC